MSKTKCFIAMLLSFILFIGCSDNDNISGPNISELDKSNWREERRKAYKQIEQARKEFFKGIPSAVEDLKAKGISPNNLDYNNLKLKEKITSKALKSAMFRDHNSLVEFLRNEKLYKKFKKIYKKYNKKI